MQRHQVGDDELVGRRRRDRRHRQHRGDAEGDARRVRVATDPEADPRDDDDEDRRNVQLQDEVADVATQVEHGRQTRVVAFMHAHWDVARSDKVGGQFRWSVGKGIPSQSG